MAEARTHYIEETSMEFHWIELLDILDLSSIVSVIVLKILYDNIIVIIYLKVHYMNHVE